MSTKKDSEGYAKLLDSGRHSDFEIECQGQVFKVHKGLICAKSDFFDKLCDSNFVEGTSHRVKLDDEDPAIVARMLIFIYTGTYPVSAVSANTLGHSQFRNIHDGANAAFPTEHGDSGVIEWHVATVSYHAAFRFEANKASRVEWCPRAMLHAATYCIGEKYGITGLQAHASRRFLLAVCQKEDNIIELEHWSPSRMEALWNEDSDRMTFPPLAKLVRTVYDMTPPHCHELRDVLVWYTKLYSMGSQHFSPIESLEMVRAIEETPRFAADLALSVPSQAWFCCTVCGTQDPKLNPVLARRFKCGWIDRCEKPKCLKAIQERSICLYCYRFGTLALTEPDESLDDMESD